LINPNYGHENSNLDGRNLFHKTVCFTGLAFIQLGMSSLGVKRHPPRIILSSSSGAVKKRLGTDRSTSESVLWRRRSSQTSLEESSLSTDGETVGFLSLSVQASPTTPRSPARSPTSGRTMGFLALIHKTKPSTPSTPSGSPSPRGERVKEPPENSQERLQRDYYLLRKLFPDFPEQMLLALVLREQGRSHDVALFLRDRGWGRASDRSTDIDSLSTVESPQLTVPYFWGLSRPDPHAMKRFKPGSFFTILKAPNEYYLVFLDCSQHLVQRPTESPEVTPSETRLYHLCLPVRRPKTLHPSYLVYLPPQITSI
jgi:hypothetical protein